MSPTTPSHRPVDVFADIVVAAPAGRLTMKGAGRSIGISGGSWHAYRDLAISLRHRSRSERHEILTRLDRALRSADLELSFQIQGSEVARMGGAGEGWAARVLALPGVNLRVGRLLAALIRHPIRSKSAA